ncbi:DUF3619 family protein [Janthinobacterium agaricidamnosum]|uniref:COG: DNA-directed RNA polymerase specialized sigma subunit n=1 Tax=Janthinobacterium agaricidamnosum NBRC 102515 = DSM 9628 TaxID=1349767 RepID=W0V8T5_9BURK|nr:DUF3619 family protein [Janthinobacterium agaricidamnosum]CDG83985.1 COG: DNA-directed RNA polymerase specialized sigma subunit [Janthinobacterium agaricidamnosum NBRC 102515 = DSM 9628]
MNTDDLNFAYKVRHALNEKLDDLPASTTDRLASARQLALARKKAHVPVPVAQVAVAGNAGGFFSQPFSWLGKMSVVIPLLVMAAGLVGIYQFEQEQHIAELAELDAAVLSDELPLSAYLDHGFNAYLTKREQ